MNKKGGEKKVRNNYLLTTIIALVVGGASFWGGMKYQQSKLPSRGDFQAMRGMRPGLPEGPQSGIEVIRGEIIDKDEEGITVKLPDESSKIILVSETTQINKATEETIDDLVTGEQVMVFGKKNSDESISASQIQLNFAMRVRPE